MARAKWITALAQTADQHLRDLSKTLKKQLRRLRAVVFLLVVALLAVYGAVVGAFLRPEWMAYWFAASVVVLSVPFIALVALVALPLRLKSITRLIDMGYPANAKELGIRVIARKLHEESIETEELLVDTALNEARKAVRKYKPRVEQALRDREDSRGQGDPGPRPPQDPGRQD